MIKNDRNHLKISRTACTVAGLIVGAFLGATLRAPSVDHSVTTNLLDTRTLSMAEGVSEPQISTTTSPAKQLIHPISSYPSKQRSFLSIAKDTGTDKVKGSLYLHKMLMDGPENLEKPNAKNPKCRGGQFHFYDTIYQRWLGTKSTDNADPFQFLEIGFYNGRGFDAFAEFLPRAEMHSMEISCLPEGKQEDGKWPWGNFASKNPRYQELLDAKRLHCGDASDVRFLREIWTTHMKRPDSPPFMAVVDDGAHLSDQMAATLFFWFPRLAPGGILVIEDIEPFDEADQFRTGVLPQVLHDLHYCGDPGFDELPCFPTIQPLLQSVHCEMHICVFERNAMPAMELSDEESRPPEHALDATNCLHHLMEYTLE